MAAPNSPPAEHSRNGPWITSPALFPMGKIDGEHPPPSADGSRPSGQPADGRFCCGCVSIRRLIGFRCIFILLSSVALFVSAVFWLPPFLHYADQKDLSRNPSYRGGIFFRFWYFLGLLGFFDWCLVCGVNRSGNCLENLDLVFEILWFVFADCVWLCVGWGKWGLLERLRSVCLMDLGWFWYGIWGVFCGVFLGRIVWFCCLLWEKTRLCMGVRSREETNSNFV